MNRRLILTDVVKNISLLLMFLYFAAVMILSYKTEYFQIANITFVLFGGMVILYRIIKISIVYSSFYVYSLIFIVFGVMSYYWAIEKSVVTPRVETYFSLIILAIIIINIIEDEKELSFAFKSFAIAGGLMCIYTILFYGFDEIKMMMMEGQRIGGEISEENSFGLICSLSFSFCIGYAMFEKKKIFLLTSLLLAISVMMSGSRTALLGIIFSFALAIVLNTTSKKIIGTVITITVLIIVLNTLSQSEYFSMIFNRMESLRNIFDSGNNMVTADGSTEVRFEMIKYGLRWFKEKPIVGYGVDQYNILYEINFGQRRPSHNFYVQILVEFGMVGFILWMWLFGELMKGSYKLIKESTESKIVFIAVTHLLLMGFGNMYTSEKVFWITLGLCFSFCRVYYNKLKDR